MEFSQSLVNLDEWFETWKKAGLVYGFVVHQHAENLLLAPDVLTQAKLILSHINIFDKTKDECWLNKAKEEADALLEIYFDEAHHFCYATYEHKPYHGASLVYDAFGSFALLKLFQKTQDKNYLKTAADCIENGIMTKFDGRAIVCGETRKISILPRKIPFRTLNMNSIAVAAMIELMKSQPYSNFRRQTGLINEMIMKNQNTEGGFEYDDSRVWSRNISLYQSWTMLGLIESYEFEKNEKIFNSLKKAAGFLYKMIDQSTNLFFHRLEKKKIEKYPEWIAATGAALYVFERLRSIGISYDVEKVWKAILDSQYINGAFPTSIGYTNIFLPHFSKPEPLMTTWRDALPIAGWNSLLLEALSLKIPPQALPEAKINFPLEIQTDKDFFEQKFKIIENHTNLRFVDGGKIIFYCEKTNPKKYFNEIKMMDFGKRAEIKYKLRPLYFIRGL